MPCAKATIMPGVYCSSLRVCWQQEPLPSSQLSTMGSSRLKQLPMQGISRSSTPKNYAIKASSRIALLDPP